MNKELMSLCLLAAVLCIGLFLPSTEASPNAIYRSDVTKEISAKSDDKSLVDSRCANCDSDCPTTCPPPTHPPVTPPPCHDCPPTCPPIHKPPPTKFPNLPSITFSTNCDFCDHDLYTLNCIESPFECANRCAVDIRCSHFTFIANLKGGTCMLKKAFGSGGSWASPVSSPSAYVCGYIPRRALIGIFLDICVGFGITGSVRSI